MRIHYSRKVTQLLRQAENAQLRAMVRSLLEDPRPGWAQPVPERPGHFDFFFGEHWIVYVIDESGPETIITVTLTES